MLAIQMQLAEVTRLAQHNLEISQIALEEIAQRAEGCDPGQSSSDRQDG